MAGFYGSNIVNDNFNNYQFEKIYPNRKSMDDNTLLDDVSLNGYVLIEYTYTEEGIDKDEVYKINAQIDLDNYNGQNFDNTIWIKKMTNDGLKYLNIGIVNTTIPKFELRIDSPMELNSSDEGPYFDADGTDLVQYLHVQVPWRFKLGNIELNEAGFNKETPSQKKEEKDQITLSTERSSDTEYANDPKEEGEKKPDDTQVLNINLPVIGNTISEVWDIVYGKERNSPPESLQGRLDSFNSIQENTLLSKDTNNAFVGIGTQNDNWINSNIDDEGLHINHNKANAELMKSIVNFGFGKMGFDDAGHMVAISNTSLILDCGTASN